jgi:hypothetical protein
MPAITTTIGVDRSAPGVYAYATDPSRFSEWQKGVIDGSMAHHGPPSVGDRCLTTRKIGLANRPIASEVTHVDPPRSWGVPGIDGPIRSVVDVTVEPLTDTTSRITISLDFVGYGIGKLLVPLFVRRQARHEMPANLAALKQHLEQSDTNPPGRSR